LFTHAERNLTFALIVDDFGVKYTSKADAEFLIEVLSKRYELTIDWTGSTFSGMHIDWDYDKGTCDISMPVYVEKALGAFAHPKPTRPQDAPHPYTKPDYGAKIQMTKHNESEPLQPKEITRLQQVIGKFLWYA
jgi:hypothetical protein